jgi:hypothetical protein
MLQSAFFILTTLVAFPTTKQIEDKIVMLRSDMRTPKRAKRLRMIAETIRTYAPKSGFNTDADVNLIVAMMKKESDFAHIPGAAGEWGMLQVIPTEQHIKMAAKRYRCHKSEIKNVFYTKIKCRNGKMCSISYRPCRKSLREGSNRHYANVGVFRKDGYHPLNWKTTLFLKYSPRGAIATGIREMRFWKRRYDRSLKRRYWTQFPAWYFKRKPHGRTMAFHRRWWRRVTSLMGDRIWVSHYNWGSRLAPGRISRWYPKMVYKFLKILESEPKRKTDAKS